MQESKEVSLLACISVLPVKTKKLYSKLLLEKVRNENEN